ncbi:MAG: hypothetical protein R3B40_13785 [Polyangiales bacterium]
MTEHTHASAPRTSVCRAIDRPPSSALVCAIDRPPSSALVYPRRRDP